MAPASPSGLVRKGNQEVDTDSDGTPVSLYYELYKLGSATEPSSSEQHTAHAGGTTTATSDEHHGARQPMRLVLIMGFAATCQAWYPLLIQLQHLWAHQDGPALEVLLMDNRGVGNSSSPKRQRDYSTLLMARDVLTLMDQLGWQQAHVGGFSMGGMIATKLAAEAMERCHSLTLMSTSSGGTDVIPRSWRALKLGIRAAMASSAEQRARWDLKLHFTKTTLLQVVPKSGVSVRDVLYAEYVAMSRAERPQPEHGFKGQMAACWHHGVTKADVKAIRSGKAPVWLLHGRHDLVAPCHLAESLATRMGAPCVFVDGAHFIPRENAVDVALLMQSIMTLGYPPARMARIQVPTFFDGMALDMELVVKGNGDVTASATAVHVNVAVGANASVAMAAAQAHGPSGNGGGDAQGSSKGVAVLAGGGRGAVLLG